MVGHLVRGCSNCTLSISTAAEGPHPNRRSNERCFFHAESRFRGLVRRSTLLRCTRCMRGCCNAPHSCIRRRLRTNEGMVLRVRVRNTVGVGRGVPRTLLIFMAPPAIRRLRHHLANEKARATRIVTSELTETNRRTRNVKRCSCVLIGSAMRRYMSRLRRVVIDRRSEMSEGTRFVTSVRGRAGTFRG